MGIKKSDDWVDIEMAYMSFRDIAEKLGVPLATVKSSYLYAMRKINGFLALPKNKGLRDSLKQYIDDYHKEKESW